MKAKDAVKLLEENQTLYHFSLNKKDFKPFTHFGTKEAAIERANGRKGFLYTVSMDTGKAILINDVSGDTNAFELANEFNLSKEEINSIKDIHKYPEISRWDKLKEILLTKGVKLAKYKNKIEDKGSISFLVIDPSIINIIEVG